MKRVHKSAPAIIFQDYSLSYGSSKNRAPLHVLNKINISIEAGEIITIVGPSGCGKTTLLRAVAGLIGNDDDSVSCEGLLNVFNMPVKEAKQKKMFSFTFQNPVLLPWRNVRENVSLPLEIMNNVGRHSSQEIVDEMLLTVGMQDFASAMPSEISGGMSQRANLARALVQEPRVLIMDEPFGSLDEVTREKLNFELLRIHRLKKPTILFVTHSLSEATLLGDRVLVLTNRPSTIREIIPIELPRERKEDILESSTYSDLVRKVRVVFSQDNHPK